MELVLEIINTEQAAPSQVLRTAFEHRGGVIGRKAYADWVIVDPGSQVSREHARVSYNGSQFLLKDVSTNGVRFKASGERLPLNEDIPIEEGAVYLIGHLEIRAHLIRHAVEADAVPPSPAALSSAMIIPAEARIGEALTPVAAIEPVQCADYAPIEREHLVVPTLIPAPPAPEPAALLHALAPTDHNAAFWQRFAQTLGIDLKDLDPPGREALAIETARLFTLGIDHLQQCLRTRNELKNELRLALTTGQYTQHNPIKHAATASEAIKALLLDTQSRSQAERSISRAFRDLQAHQVALLGASRAALRSTLEHFAPQHLSLRFERDGQRPMFVSAGSSWRAYERYHDALSQDDDWSERLLARDFARAYEEQVRLIDSLHTDPKG